MNKSPADTLKHSLEQALDNALCSQLWLGYGNTLFLGLGNEIISPPPPNNPHPQPQYELQTYFSDWFIERKLDTSQTSVNKRFEDNEAASILVGTRVVNWELSNTFLSLTIRFEPDIELRIEAWSLSELDAEQKSKDAWALILPDESSIAVSCSGAITLTDK